MNLPADSPPTDSTQRFYRPPIALHHLQPPGAVDHVAVLDRHSIIKITTDSSLKRGVDCIMLIQSEVFFFFGFASNAYTIAKPLVTTTAKGCLDESRGQFPTDCEGQSTYVVVPTSFPIATNSTKHSDKWECVRHQGEYKD